MKHRMYIFGMNMLYGYQLICFRDDHINYYLAIITMQYLFMYSVNETIFKINTTVNRIISFVINCSLGQHR